MKKMIVLTLFLALIATAQFKPKANEEPRVSDSFITPSSSSDWFNFFNPNNFHMRHSYSASYTTFGRHGIAMQQYTNTMTYQFTPNLDARVDLSLQNSPYNTFESRLNNQFNKVYLSRAEINYRPWDNTYIRLQYREFPYSIYGYGYQPFGGMFSGLGYYEE